MPKRMEKQSTSSTQKGWFKHSDQILTYDRLVYYDIDTRRYIIKAGIGKGEFYTPNQEIIWSTSTRAKN